MQVGLVRFDPLSPHGSTRPINTAQVTVVRYTALLAMLGGTAMVITGALIMTPETATGRGSMVPGPPGPSIHAKGHRRVIPENKVGRRRKMKITGPMREMTRRICGRARENERFSAENL